LVIKLFEDKPINISLNLFFEIHPPNETLTSVLGYLDDHLFWDIPITKALGIGTQISPWHSKSTFKNNDFFDFFLKDI
jgi:hypothetical protein